MGSGDYWADSLSAAVDGGHWERDRERRSYETCGALVRVANNKIWQFVPPGRGEVSEDVYPRG